MRPKAGRGVFLKSQKHDNKHREDDPEDNHRVVFDTSLYFNDIGLAHADKEQRNYVSDSASEDV